MSESDQETLRIDAVEVPGVSGLLGLCACPGGRQPGAAAAGSSATLENDVKAIRAFGASGLVTLVEDQELAMLGLASLPELLQENGLWWKHLPITDMGIPGRPFEARWLREGPEILACLARGQHVVLHCWAGLGRTGTIAARLLVESGLDADAAVLRVRTARPGSIQTRKQEKYVLKLQQKDR